MSTLLLWLPSLNILFVSLTNIVACSCSGLILIVIQCYNITIYPFILWLMGTGVVFSLCHYNSVVMNILVCLLIN